MIQRVKVSCTRIKPFFNIHVKIKKDGESALVFFFMLKTVSLPITQLALKATVSTLSSAQQAFKVCECISNGHKTNVDDA